MFHQNVSKDILITRTFSAVLFLLCAAFVSNRGYDCFKKYSSPLMSFLDYMEHLYSKACYVEMQQIYAPSFDDWTTIVSKCGYLVLKLLLIKQIKQLHRQLGTQIIDLVLLEILSNYRRLSSAPHSGPHYRK